MWALLINPVAGQGQGAIVAKAVAGFLSQNQVEYTIVTGNSATALSEHLKIFIAKYPSCDGVIAVGGDGLFHLALQSVISAQIPLAIIPAGTGNDFVRTLGWDLLDVKPQLHKILQSSATSIDLGLVDGEWFGSILSSGFDSIVNERANTLTWPKGPIKYKLSIAMELPRFKPRHYDIYLDDRTISTDAMLIAVANGRFYGGGMLVCPNASITDGSFDVMVLHPVSKLEFLKVFPMVFSGSHIHHPAVEIVRSKNIHIEAKAVAYSDGERIGQLPVQAEVVPGALRTWVS